MYLAAFLSVFFLGSLPASFSFVAPPINVTLHCHNLHNVLTWSYTHFPPGLRFRVDIRRTQAEDGYPDEIWVNSSAQLQADVSFLSDPQNAYYLEVTAVIGRNESAPEEGLSFSYFKDSPANHICNLDFPSVNVTTQHDGAVRVRFTHPSLVYFQKLPSSPSRRTRKKKSHELPGFRYDVVLIHQVIHQERQHGFHCETSVCEETISVDAAQKNPCLKMSGELEKISVQATQEYCVRRREDTPSYLIPLFVVCGLSALSALGFVLYMVYRKHTAPNTPSPKSLEFPNPPTRLISEEFPETFFVPEVEPSSPTPLPSAEERESTPFVHRATEPELRLPIGVSGVDEGPCDDEEEEEGAMNEENEEPEEPEEPEYMSGNHLEEEESASGYEKRPMLVALAPDELTVGYRG
ncbi:interferon gamma receptor 1-like [Pseudoliparis swirei]|uniref:interferon gamma receptor 1-like n=1 Tax=Pseudoliparis swirei TaxID=2059687 RepID=UPI0024BDD253|nr:interferon gamma receptor 1-like [Pseudoliparis swirei]